MQKLPFIKGVNLGGWLVLEKWITPSLFAGTETADEYTFTQTADAEEKIKQHRNNFITAEDINWLGSCGINALRIPVGYWILDGDWPYTSAIERLDWVIEQAKNSELLVLIDLHGAPGSQNGFDHSGRVGQAAWHKKKYHRQKTISALVRLAERYKNEPHVFGIELLNEPSPTRYNFKLRKFYNLAYQEITKVARPGLHVVYHDAFRPKQMFGAVKNLRPDFPVLQDTHWYQFFTDNNSRIWDANGYFQHLGDVGELFAKLNKNKGLIIGEWSMVLSEKLLKSESENTKAKLMKKHGQLQLEIYRTSSSGWFYWTYKTETEDYWNFRTQVEVGNIIL